MLDAHLSSGVPLDKTKPGCAGDAGAVAGRLLRGVVLGRFAAETAAASALGEV